ncbi:MAG TPA: GFA family protein [Polyangia bacterium]|nr:GFA family protein [Polyangia bacterium]
MANYMGSCHCGNVKYEVQDLTIDKVVSCNCSMCRRKGALLAFVPATQFKLISGEGDLKNYHFNRNVIDHLFCGNCGVSSFARGKRPDGTPIAALNVRCLDGVDLDKLDIQHFDGASL